MKSRKLFTKDNHKKLHTKKTNKFHVSHLFVSEQKRSMLKCPDREQKVKTSNSKIKKALEDFEGTSASVQTKLVRLSELISFDLIHLEEKSLDIPEFKQFKNNMSDFTADGEEQFSGIIDQIKEYLGDNTTGEGLTLSITGSASQIPTSYHPNKPNFGVNPDGSSIKGETNVENNIFLAHARAMELAYRIKAKFMFIEVITPELNDIKLGATKWTYQTQKALDAAYLRGDRAGMDKVFEPFQKEQWVKVESNDTFVKTVQPNAIRSYSIAATPRFNIKGEPVKSSLVVSKSTYNKIAANKTFVSIDDRANFMEALNLKIEKSVLYGSARWYIIGGQEELSALAIEDDYEKLLRLYELDMIHPKDYALLEQIITEKYVMQHLYKYILKPGSNAGYY